MQKRSFPKEIRYDQIGLDPRLPIRGGGSFSQKDAPITFLHFHECLELGYCYSGSGIFMVGEKILPFQKGDVSFIDRSEVHLARSSPGTSSEWTWIYLDPIRLVGTMDSNLDFLDPAPLAGPNFNNLLPALRYPVINRIVLEIIDEWGTSRRGREDCLRALAWQLMVVMGRLAPEQSFGARKPEYDRIVPALQHLADGGYADKVDIGCLAKLCHMSPPHFRRTFLRAVGKSPREYWHDMRLRTAAVLLRQGSLSVLEISLQVGFETLSSFNRLFLKKFQMPPRDWKRGTTMPPDLGASTP